MTRPDQYADIGGFLIRHIIKLIISGPGRCFPLHIIRSVPVSPPDLGKSASFSSSRLMDWMRFEPRFTVYHNRWQELRKWNQGRNKLQFPLHWRKLMVMEFYLSGFQGVCVSTVFLIWVASVGEKQLIQSQSEDKEHESVSLTEAVCSCLYMWPIVVCSNELWYEVLCTINLLIWVPCAQLESAQFTKTFAVVYWKQSCCSDGNVSSPVRFDSVKGKDKGKAVWTSAEVLFQLNSDSRH